MPTNSLAAIEEMEPGDGVVRVTACALKLAARRWHYQTDQAAAIERHWQARLLERPQMFNGVVHLLDEGLCGTDGFSGELLATDFKSYLHWRDAGFPAAGVRDAFGSALIRSAEGYVLLGRQRAGNINAGLAYLPGGFIDARDVTSAGTIDIAASILRELHEETGQLPVDFHIVPGFLLTRWQALMSFALELVSPLPADALRQRIMEHIAADPHSELVDAVIVRSTAEAREAGVHPYAGVLLEWLFAGP